ncbi:MAG: VCBS repeat-containing protein [Candidatus Krumholzibacteriota bacterium]|nr:VCBS repeat-containing protein [Candidatus Krumholzibacteriota bacterium]
MCLGGCPPSDGRLPIAPDAWGESTVPPAPDGVILIDLVVANNLSDNISVLLGKGDGTLEEAKDYPAGDGPYAVSSCYLNADSDVDLAVASYNSDQVSVLLGKGGGTFGEAMHYKAGNGPRCVFSCDMNGDGEPDLVTANYFSDDATVLLNIVNK